MESQQTFDTQKTEQSGQHPDVKEEAGAAGNPAGVTGRKVAARNDHLYVGMMGQCRAPSMQHCRHADPRTKALVIGSDGHHRLGRGAEQQVIGRFLVPERETGLPRRPRKCAAQCALHRH